MSDIVERLRAKPDTEPLAEIWETGRPDDAARTGLGELNLYHQAAAEIERLRERMTNALDALNNDDISGATLILYEGVRERAGVAR